MSSVDENAGTIDTGIEKYTGGVISDGKLFIPITRYPNWIFSKQSDTKASFSVAISALIIAPVPYSFVMCVVSET